jgi:hypothetical protein
MAEGERTPGKDYVDYGGRSRWAAVAPCGVPLLLARAAAIRGATHSSPWSARCVEAVASAFGGCQEAMDARSAATRRTTSARVHPMAVVSPGTRAQCEHACAPVCLHVRVTIRVRPHSGGLNDDELPPREGGLSMLGLGVLAPCLMCCLCLSGVLFLAWIIFVVATVSGLPCAPRRWRCRSVADVVCIGHARVCVVLVAPPHSRCRGGRYAAATCGVPGHGTALLPGEHMGLCRGFLVLHRGPSHLP